MATPADSTSATIRAGEDRVMATPADSTSATVEAEVSIIDCDVHPIVKGGIDSLYPFMPSDWAKRFRLKGDEISFPRVMRYTHPRGGVVRVDASTPDGGPGGSDPNFTKVDLLDRWNIGLALLISLEAGALAAGSAGPDESVVLCRAFNDFFLSEWTTTDRRYRYALVVPTEDPSAAASEIRRLGPNPSVAAIFLPLVNVLMGHRQYDPIYRAAESEGLPILVHGTGTEFRFFGGPAPIGWPESYTERYINLCQIPVPNLTNLVFTGAFERFPSLRVLFVEFGFAWALPLMWRMDKAWKGLRIETPWVKKKPSEYIHQHVRFSTQPIDEPDDHRQLHQFIEMMGDDVLLFSTDYPHWDNDNPTRTLRGLPDQSRRRILSLNAQRTLRL